jgi:hypothetical protein
MAISHLNIWLMADSSSAAGGRNQIIDKQAGCPGSAAVLAAHLLASQPLLANNHASSRPLADSEIAGIRICEPAGRRRSQGSSAFDTKD